MKQWIAIIFTCLCTAIACGTEPFTVEQLASNRHGIRARFPDEGLVLIVSGSPEEMGRATGELAGSEIRAMGNKILVAAAGYVVTKDDWFFDRIDEVINRTMPYTPKRFVDECDAMSQAAGIPLREGRHLNFFPEMFHCSGIAVRGNATVGGEVIHARVLDYMRDLQLYDYATTQIFLPDGFYSWASIGYAGFIGTVTAMNEHGLAMGEMGGSGYGDWDGIPMSFLVRRIMEECRTVPEAVELIKNTPLTCEYYYILSDADGNMTAVTAKAGKDGELRFFAPGEPDPRIPEPPEDTVFISAKDRAKKLHERLLENYGDITPETMIELIKAPVAMKSNLHNAIFLPNRLEILFAHASAEKIAADAHYSRFRLPDVIAAAQKYLVQK